MSSTDPNTNPYPNVDAMELLRRVMTREGFLAAFVFLFGGIAGLVVTIPIVGYVLSPLFNQPKDLWRYVGTVDSIAVGETKLVKYRSNAPLEWAGSTALQGAYLRRTGVDSFIAYAEYCTHLGCPIHWLPKPQIFLCPCHGSVFNADGTVAGGPAGRPLFQYEVRTQNGRIYIKTHPLPIIS